MANLYIVKEDLLAKYDLRQVISHYMLNIDVVSVMNIKILEEQRPMVVSQ